MKKPQIIVLTLVVSFIVIQNILFDSSESTDGVENDPELDSTWSAYGDNGTLNSWPGSSEGIELAENLTAKNFYIVVDGSGSMHNAGCSDGMQKLSAAKSSLNRFIDNIPSDDNLGLYAFDMLGINERVPIGPETHEKVKKAVNALSASGGTPLSQAVIEGREALTTQGKRQLGYGEYNLVIVTDGQANDSNKLHSVVQSLLQDTPIVVHTIGFCISSDHTLNQPGYTVYKAANNPQALDKGLQQVLAEAPEFDVSEFGGQ